MDAVACDLLFMLTDAILMTSSQSKAFVYKPINDPQSPGTPGAASAAAAHYRSRFYGRLAPANKDNALVMPAHTVPFDIFTVGKQGGKQSSLITIMSLWNTMMGTSILTMPWAASVNNMPLPLATNHRFTCTVTTMI